MSAGAAFQSVGSGPPRCLLGRCTAACDSLSPVLLLLAVAAASAVQTAILALLPTLVDGDPAIFSRRDYDFHVATLTAVHPLAALLLAPLLGWLADRFDYRVVFRAGLVVLALSTAPIGTVSLPMLYLLRILAGVAAAAIIPLALLCASFAGYEPAEQARRFTWLTAFVFLGDLTGPLLAEASAGFTPATPLLVVAIAIAAVAMLLWLAPLPERHALGADPDKRRASSLPITLILLLIAIVGGAGLAAIHVNLLVTRDGVVLSRQAIAAMLSLCGVAMLAAQIFHTKVPWLITMPRRLAGLTLTSLAVTLFLFPLGTTPFQLSAIIFAAGWSSACLRLVTSFWISGTTVPTGSKLGLQHAAASIGQALAPVTLALAPPQAQPYVLWAIGWFSLLLLATLPFVWKHAAAPANATG